MSDESRLTTIDGNYCEDICGMAKSCKRLHSGDTRCQNALFYERLQKYENKYCKSISENNINGEVNK